MVREFVLRLLFALFRSTSFSNPTAVARQTTFAADAWGRSGSALWRMAVMAAAILCPIAVPSANAQTAQFSYAIATLGGGFSNPNGVAVDRKGDIFVADTGNNAVEEIVAVDGLIPASPTINTVGSGFSAPTSLAVDAGGDVFVGESGIADGQAVMEIVAGTGGAAAGTVNSSSTVNTVGSEFGEAILGVAVDANGDVFVADTDDNAVKEIVAGTGGAAAGAVNSSSTVTVVESGFLQVYGVALDASGDVFVADLGLGEVKEIVAGTGGAATGTVNSSSTVLTVGSGFNDPSGVALDASGDVFVSDNSSVVKEIVASGGEVSSSSTVLTLVGSGLSSPVGLAVDGNGNVFVADSGDNAVKEMMVHGVSLGTVAVGATETPGQTLYFTFTGGGSGITASVLTQGAAGLDFSDAGTGTCDTNGSSHAYSTGDTCTVNVTFAPKYAGTRYGAVNLLNGSDSVIATAYVYGTGQAPELVFPGNPVAQTLGGGFSYPFGVAVDASGDVYVADTENYLMKEIPPGCTSAACVKTLVGNFTLPGGNQVFGIVVDGSGNVYFSSGGLYEIPVGCTIADCVVSVNDEAAFGLALDAGSNLYFLPANATQVWEVPAGCTSDDCTITKFGGGFSKPHGVAVDAIGNIYVADTLNNAIKEMPPTCTSSSCVTTLGGGFQVPYGVAVDASGNIYVADLGSGADVKEMPPGCTSSSCVATLATGVDPGGIALDGSGNVYISDQAGASSVEELNFITPPTLSFPNTNAGAKSGPLTVTLRNIGNEPLSIPSLGGENPFVPPPFSLDASTTCPEVPAFSSSGSLAAGASCNYAVDFAPVEGGTDSNDLLVTDNNLNVTNANQLIGLSGTGVAPTLITPTVSVTPASSSITTLQSLQVTITVSGGSGNPTPTGGVNLSSGSYNSGPATTLSGGSATFTIPAAALAVGSDTLTARYLPDINSYLTYNSASGTAPVSVVLPIGTCTNPNPNPNPNPAVFANPGDFNGDCKSDILWQSSSSGQLYEWLMNGTSTLNQLSPGGASSPWGIVGIGDFNGDGKADMLWQNSSTGQLYMWLMNGASITSQLTPGTVASPWKIVGIGDFNGDGKSDILWQNSSTGQLYIWLMNGASITSQISPGTVGSPWGVVGIGDFNGDGKADILWQNSSTGQLYIWMMNGTSITSQLTPGTVAAPWTVVGIGDFDGDGKSDILWRNSTTGQLYTWFMNGASITNQLTPGTVNIAWNIYGIGDYNGDGKADILWQNNSTGQLYIWLMNGGSITTQQSPGTVSPPWQVVEDLDP